MIDKELLFKTNDLVAKSKNKDLNIKISKIMGMYEAYEISKNQELLEIIINHLNELIIDLIEEKDKYAKKVIIDNEELEDLKEFLINNGYGLNTIDGYIRAIKRIIKNNNLNSFTDLCNNFYEITCKYDKGQDQVYHNMHLSALNKVSLFINELKEGVCFKVIYEDNSGSVPCMVPETFHIIENNPWETLKLAAEYALKLQKEYGVVPVIYFSDGITKVPKVKVNLALKSF